MATEKDTQNGERPLLSIVIPAYNEEARLPDSLQTITEYITQQTYSAEVIVVDNNSSDRTHAIAQEFEAKFPCVRVMFEGAQGKGAAVRTGMLAAKGQYRFICDADLSMPIEEIGKFLPPALNNYDIAIASREAPGAVRYDEPWYRHLMGRVFNTIVRLFAVGGLQDTQCGFKMFRGDIADMLFPFQTLDGWAFDVEILYVAQKRSAKIIEVPINWYYKANTRIHPIKDSIDMFIEVFKIRQNGYRGLYNHQPHDTQS